MEAQEPGAKALVGDQLPQFFQAQSFCPLIKPKSETGAVHIPFSV